MNNDPRPDDIARWVRQATDGPRANSQRQILARRLLALHGLGLDGKPSPKDPIAVDWLLVLAFRRLVDNARLVQCTHSYVVQGADLAALKDALEERVLADTEGLGK